MSCIFHWLGRSPYMAFFHGNTQYKLHREHLDYLRQQVITIVIIHIIDICITKNTNYTNSDDTNANISNNSQCYCMLYHCLS